MTVERRFSLEEDFMNYKTNDLLYSFMRSLSTASPQYDENGKYICHREYLTKKAFNKEKKVIAGICGCTTRTIANHINKLAEAGLIDEGIEVIKVNGVEYEYECYWFPYDKEGNYKLLNKEFLKYLVYTRNTHAIRIYLYLLNKYEWKKNYIFTKKELKEVLGYAESTKSADELIGCVLDSFSREGIIKYEKHYEEADVGTKTVPVERMKLLFVTKKEDELRRI